jgi:tRNA A-37 threonylcarbamoyl transferase component Bud32
MNKSRSYEAIRKNEIDWLVLSGYARTIPEELVEKVRRVASYPECRIIRENNVRVSMFLPHPETGEVIFAKRYKCRGLKDIVKYFFVPSKALSEWKIMNAFRDRGIPVPRPLAYGEKRKGGCLLDSYLFTEALATAVPLRDFYEQSLIPCGPPHHHLKKSTVIKKLAALVSSMHAEGFFYRDLHAGNVLVVERDDEALDLYLVDFHKAWHLRRLPDFMRIRDLAQLKNSLAVSPADQLRFLKAYALGAPRSFNHLKQSARRIEKKAEQLWSVHLKSRTKRCLVKSTEFEVHKDLTRSLYYRKTYSEDLLADVLSHYGNPSSAGRITVVKETPKEVVSFTTLSHRGEQRKILIKEARFIGLWNRLRYCFFKTRAKRYWIAARGLKVRGVATPDAIACIENRSFGLPRQTILLMEFVDHAYELNDYVLKRFSTTVSPQDAQVKNRFIKACALRLRALHEKGIYHADLKSNNILVKENPSDSWEFYFIDLDSVSFCRKLSFKKRSNNLAQINASIADCMTVSDRLLFFKTYARGTLLLKKSKTYFQRIMEIGRQKNTQPYGVTFPPPGKQSTR